MHFVFLLHEAHAAPRGEAAKTLSVFLRMGVGLREELLASGLHRLWEEEWKRLSMLNSKACKQIRVEKTYQPTSPTHCLTKVWSTGNCICSSNTVWVRTYWGKSTLDRETIEPLDYIMWCSKCTDGCWREGFPLAISWCSTWNPFTWPKNLRCCSRGNVSDDKDIPAKILLSSTLPAIHNRGGKVDWG